MLLIFVHLSRLFLRFSAFPRMVNRMEKSWNRDGTGMQKRRTGKIEEWVTIAVVSSYLVSSQQHHPPEIQHIVAPYEDLS